MPRKNNQTYLAQRAVVQREWFERYGGALPYLSRSEQLELHRYFATTRDLFDEAALIYRRRISSGNPSLPQRAGRAFANLERAIANPTELLLGGIPVRRGTLYVNGLAHADQNETIRRLTQLYFSPAMQKLLDEIIRKRLND